MAVPRAVQQQRDNAEAIQLQLQGKNNGSQAQPAPPLNEPPSTEPAEDWEKRFKNMKQAHDTVVPELRNQNEELSARVSELEGLINKATPAHPAAQEVIFSEEEIEEYGEDLLELVKRVAKSMAIAPNDSSVTEELKELKDQFGNLIQNQVKSEEDRFFEALDKLVPDWEKCNEDQRFKDWLAEIMPLTNTQRQVFLKQAQQSFDAQTVAEYFNSWKGEVGLQTYYPDTVGTGNGDIVVNSGSQDTYIFTGDEVAQFYDDRRRGRYKGREDEARQLEQRIFQAQKESRVR